MPTLPSKIWLRANFEMRCLTNSFAGSVAAFEKQANQILSTVAEYDYDILGMPETISPLVGLRSESCSWTVYMVIEHLRLHTDFLLEAIRSLIINNELRAPTPTIRYLRPEDVGSESVDRFQDSVWAYVGFANNLIESRKHRQSTGSIRHPLYGLLNVKRLSIYGQHQISIHRRQIQAIIASIGVA